MSQTTDLAVRKTELKCRRSGRRTLSFFALIAALGICAFAAVRVQKYGIETVKNGSSGQGNGLKAVFAMLSGGMNGGKQKIDESVLQVMAQVENPEEISKPDGPFADACLPVNSTLNSGFGYRSNPFNDAEVVLHRGVDIKAADGTEVKCALSGTVKETGFNDIGGNYVRIEHPNGFVTYYGHLMQALVKEGESVERGQVIALSGHTGNVTGAHLHFQIEYGERYVDPEVYFTFNGE